MKAIKCRFIVSSQTKLYIMRHGRFSLEREREREREMWVVWLIHDGIILYE